MAIYPTAFGTRPRCLAGLLSDGLYLGTGASACSPPLCVGLDMSRTRKLTFRNQPRALSADDTVPLLRTGFPMCGFRLKLLVTFTTEHADFRLDFLRSFAERSMHAPTICGPRHAPLALIDIHEVAMSISASLLFWI